MTEKQISMLAWHSCGRPLRRPSSEEVNYKMIRTLAIVCLCTCSLLGSQELPEVLYPDASIYGFVTDETGGSLPNYVRVRLQRSDGWQAETTTDGSGRYAFKCLADGLYSLKFEADGFYVHSVEGIRFRLPDDHRIDEVMYVNWPPIDFAPDPRVNVQVLSSDGAPIPDATVRLDQPEFGVTHPTDHCGNALFFVPPGEHSLTIAKPGYAKETRTIIVEHSPVQLEVRLSAATGE